MDMDDNPLAASAYRIQGVSTLILFWDGRTLWRKSGVVSPDYLSQIFDQYALPEPGVPVPGK